MHFLSRVIDVVLAGYVVWEVAQFVPRFQELKAAIAKGDQRARTRVYQRALGFEWISALLALLALRFDWSKLSPKVLDLGSSTLLQSLPKGGDLDRGALAGVVIGLGLGTIGFVIARLKTNRRGAAAVSLLPVPWWKKLLPDFAALLPITMHERLYWAAVAISAGVCEEVVFRGWLLTTLHELSVTGTGLIVAGALLFGLAHCYQGISGIILTALAGAFFCLLYIATGSLLIPILLHSLVDLRFAFMPASRLPQPQSSYA